MLNHYLSIGWHLAPYTRKTATTEKKSAWEDHIQVKPSDERVLTYARLFPEYDWACVPKDGYVAIDLDVKDGRNGIKTFVEFCTKHGIDKPTHCVNTPSGGIHIWYRLLPTMAHPQKGKSIIRMRDIGLSDSKELSGVEFIYGNHTIHVPPSQGYTWIKACDPENAPVLPQALLELWQHVDRIAVTQEASLEPTFPKGSRHTLLVGLASRLRDVGLQGDELYQALKAVADARCQGQMPEAELRGIADHAKCLAIRSVETLADNGDDLAKSILEFSKAEKIINARNVPVEDAGADILTPTPMLAALHKWIEDGNHRKQPELTTMALIAMCATLMSRHYKFKGAMPNIYALNLVESGSGKERIKTGVAKIMQETGFGAMIGSSDLGSEAGVLDEIRIMPTVLWELDEFGSTVKSLSDKNTSAYLRDVARALLTLYPGGQYFGKAIKKIPGNKDVPIVNPHPSICAFTQPAIMWDSCSEALINNGLLGRFIVVNGRPFPRANMDRVEEPIPQDISNLLQEYCARMFNNNVALWAAAQGNCETVEMPSDETAAMRYREIYEEVEDKLEACKNNVKERTIRGRMFEKIIKLAMIHAWTMDVLNPMMTRESLDWAYKFISRFEDAYVKNLFKHMHSNEIEKSNHKLIDVIIAAGPGGITKANVDASTKWLRSGDRTHMLKEFIDDGIIATGQLADGSYGFVHSSYVRKT